MLFLLVAAWALLKAAETGRLRWLMACAVLVGLGFNIKMLEAYLVVPAFGLTYLLGTNLSFWRRTVNLALACIVMLVVSLSWATAVDLTPASSRPWVDSTTTNSEIDLAIGYNGLQRLTGNHSVGSGSATSGPPAGARTAGGTGTAAQSSGTTGSTGTGAGTGNQGGPGGNGGGPGGGPGGVGENGATGVLRLLDTQLGSQIGWLLPLAVIGFIVGLAATRPRFRILDDRQRSLVMWGMWLLTTGVFFSVALFYHTYYLVMVAPAVCALSAIAIVSLWTLYSRTGSKAWWLLPLTLLAGAGVQAYILRSYPSWSSWLTPLVMVACALGALGLVFFHVRPFAGLRGALIAVTIAVLALMVPSAAFASYTSSNTVTGAILRAGPSIGGSTGGFGGGFAPGGGNGSSKHAAAVSASPPATRRTAAHQQAVLPTVAHHPEVPGMASVRLPAPRTELEHRAETRTLASALPAVTGDRTSVETGSVERLRGIGAQVAQVVDPLARPW